MRIGPHICIIQSPEDDASGRKEQAGNSEKVESDPAMGPISLADAGCSVLAYPRFATPQIRRAARHGRKLSAGRLAAAMEL